MIPSNYFREDFYTYTAEADKNIYVVMQVRVAHSHLRGCSIRKQPNAAVSHPDFNFCTQMETKEALECVEDICAVPGLDSIVYGGMDWSGSLGFPHLPTWDLIEKEPEMLAAYDRVCAACKASGKSPPLCTLKKLTVLFVGAGLKRCVQFRKIQVCTWECRQVALSLSARS